VKHWGLWDVINEDARCKSLGNVKVLAGDGVCYFVVTGRYMYHMVFIVMIHANAHAVFENGIELR
jgi:hypothetical protein